MLVSLTLGNQIINLNMWIFFLQLEVELLTVDLRAINFSEFVTSTNTLGRLVSFLDSGKSNHQFKSVDIFRTIGSGTCDADLRAIHFSEFVASTNALGRLLSFPDSRKSNHQFKSVDIFLTIGSGTCDCRSSGYSILVNLLHPLML